MKKYILICSLLLTASIPKLLSKKYFQNTVSEYVGLQVLLWHSQFMAWNLLHGVHIYSEKFTSNVVLDVVQRFQVLTLTSEDGPSGK